LDEYLQFDEAFRRAQGLESRENNSIELDYERYHNKFSVGEGLSFADICSTLNGLMRFETHHKNLENLKH
jgi:hypothetical protein